MARLLTVFPPGAKAGSTLEISVGGMDLDEPRLLLFSSTNLSGTPKPGEANKFLVTIASNAAPGVYDARFLGRFGLSNPRNFVVGHLPELVEKQDNNTAGSAMEVPLGTVVNGHVEASAADFFRFSARKGQRVLIECAGPGIDSRISPELLLYDSSGHELERNRTGGLLDFTPAADGDYTIKLHDSLFRGGAEYFYRLSIGILPHIDFIFPPAGLAGTKGKYLIYGRNLSVHSSSATETQSVDPASEPSKSPDSKPLKIEGKPLEQLEVEIELPARGLSETLLPQRRSPAACVVEGVEYRLQTPEGGSNPELLSFATAPIIREQEPNNHPKQAQKISVPCEVVGQFYPAEDQDWFTFEAKKGEVYWAEVFSQRLGLPTSPFLLVQRVTKDEKGEETADVQELYGSENNVGGIDLKTSTADPSGRFEVKEDGTFRIQVQDLFNVTQSNPSHTYRLSLRKETPGFRLMALAPAPPQAKKDAREAHIWNAFLRRAETIPLKVLAVRRDNFDGEIQLKVEGLPSSVSYPETKIESGKTSTLLLLTAAENAPDWAGRFRIIGKGKTTGANAANQGASKSSSPGSAGLSPAATELTREAQGGSVIWNVPDYNTEPVLSRLTHDLVLAVSGQEAAPISIAAAEDQVWEMQTGTKAHIPLLVTRRGDYTETLKLKVEGHPTLDSMKEIDVNGKATNVTLELDLAKHKLPPGQHTIYLQTQTKGKYRNNAEGAQAAELAAKEAEKAAMGLAEASKKATEALAAASKKMRETETAAKTASEKLSAAKAAVEKSPDTTALVDARAAAEKAASESAAKAKAAFEAKALAEKTATEASNNAKEAEAKKTALAKRAKEMTETAKPKEVTFTFYSAPIRLKVAPPAEKKVAAGTKK